MTIEKLWRRENMMLVHARVLKVFLVAAQTGSWRQLRQKGLTCQVNLFLRPTQMVAVR